MKQAYMREVRVMKSSRYKILLVEDDTVDQMAFQRMIRQEALLY